MKTIKSITLIIIGMLFSVTSLTAANRYWIATTTANWNSTANWSTTSGGAGGASVPGSSDVAIFNSAKVGSCTINADVNVAGISIVSGYTGTISQGAYSITVGSSTYSQAAGTFTGGSGKISTKRYTLSGGTFTSTSDTLMVQIGTSFGNATTFTHSGGTFNHNNGTVAFESNSSTSTFTIDVITASLFYNVIANYPSGASQNSILTTAANDTLKAVNDFIHYTSTLSGIWRVEGDLFGTKGNGGSGKIIMHGSQNQTYTYVQGRLPNLIINKTGGTVSAAGGSANLAVQTFKLQAGTFIAPTGTLFIGGTLTASTTLFEHTAGTFNPNISLVKFDASMAGYTGTIKTLSTTPFYNVWINCTGTQVLQNSTDTLRVNNDLTLQAGTFNTGTISVKRHVTVTNTFGGSGKLAFTGTTDQDFTLTGATDKLNLTYLVIKQNADKQVVLKSAATFDQSGQSLTLKRGTIISTTSNLLAIGHGVTVNSANDSSYVDGPVKKTGNAAFTFPVGKNGQYRSIAISAPTNTTDAYTSEYFNANSNGSYSHGSKDGTLAQLSTSEYWKLDRNNGSTNVNVTLSWENTTSCGFSNTANLKVAAWNGTTWKDKGNNGTTGNTTAGTIVTNASTTYGPYTLGTSATFDCGCSLATTFGGGNTCLNNQSLASGEIWFKFLADENIKEVTLLNHGIVTTANIDKVQIYDACGGNIIGGDTMKTTSDTLLVVDVRNLSIGNYYYVRLIKSATGTGNADYDICLANGIEKIITEHPDSPWTGCGLTYLQSSLKLNTRIGPAGAGSAAGTPFTVTIPSTAIILNAYIWIETVDAGTALPNNPRVFNYQFEGTNLTAPLLATSTTTNGTCWINQNATNIYRQDVTSTLIRTNTNHAFNFNIATATQYSGLGTIACDVTGATLFVIYKEPCTSGKKEGKLVIWDGLEVVGGGNSNYQITNLGAYNSNTNASTFFIINDVENNGTTYNINNIGSQAITGNMYNFVNNTTTFTPNQQNIPLSITGNGSDCYALTVMGAYTQDNSHDCFCVKSATYDYCEATASDILASAIPHTGSVVNTTSDIRINGTLHVDVNLTFQGCSHIFLGPDARIIVDAGVQLTLVNNGAIPTTLEACDYMWDGIYVSDAGANLIATSSTFTSARNAIVSENGRDIDVSGCTFLNCHKGIVIRNYNPGLPSPPAHPCSIVGSTFSCTTLIAPYAGQRTFCGIEVKDAYGVTIGAGASAANTFDNMRYGINSFNSHLTAYNNDFSNIYHSSLSPLFLSTLEGAIYATNSTVLTLSTGRALIVGASGTNANTFTSCNIGVYANRVKSNVEYNDFNNTTRGVWLQNLRNGSTVSHNTFDNTSSWLGKGTAIQVENIAANPAQIGTTRLTIRENIIHDYIIGIWAKNIASIKTTKPFWIYKNEIYFGTTNNTTNRYGIRVESCRFVLVAKNWVEKTYADPQPGEYSRLRGISIASTTDARVYDNYPIKKMGQGIYTTGNDNGTQFYCNQFTTNFNGFFFGTATAITFQGTTFQNTHNKWITHITGANRMASCGTCFNATPDNWYYSSTATPTADYNPNPVDLPVSLNINRISNAHSTNLCGSATQPPDAIVETPDDDEREAQFGPIMRDEKSYDAYEDAYKQYDNEYAYLVFKNDNDWLTLGADDADYAAWYDSIENSNIGKLLALRELADTLLTGIAFMQAQPIDSAQTIISGITPNKLIESNELAVWDVYFRTFAIDSFALSPADSAVLFNIAYQMGSEGGIGVYMARIMLNLDVDLGESNKTDEVYFADETGEESRSFMLYPNPAKDEVSILFNGYEQGETVIVELYELTGRRSSSKQVSLSGNLFTINTSDLEAGIYLYNITVSNGDTGKGKLVIVK